MSLITESILRKDFLKKGTPKQYSISINDKLTPAAIDFLRERKIQVCKGEKVSNIEYSSPITKKNWETDTQFKNYYTGEIMDSKPESMTHLFENVLVYKDHPRIILRGKLDSLQAQIIEAQVFCVEKKRLDLAEQLEDVLHYVREILRSEVLNSELTEQKVLGMNPDEIREKSHNPQKYFNLKQMVLVNYKHGALVSKMNLLRACTRECELVAVQAFNTELENNMLIQALNRLSSCFHILAYQELTKI